MFAGGSGIGPFRGFWGSRALGKGDGRNILILGVRTRQTFSYEMEIREQVRNGNLEAHVAFSRDENGLVFHRDTRELIEQRMNPRYVDSIIREESVDVCDVILPAQMGGLGGYIYVCGSAAFYETVLRGLLSAFSQHRIARTSNECILARAFAERRVMLDIYSAPRPMLSIQPVITIANLARNTGGLCENARTWIGVHGCVYDVTDFLPIHPGGIIIAASGGLDATKTFDQIGHTSDAEVQSLLAKYFIGYLARPTHLPKELANLRDGWEAYLRGCVESLTTLCLEVRPLQNERIWFSDGLLDIGCVRQFYQFQSRFIQDCLDSLFGAM